MPRISVAHLLSRLADGLAGTASGPERFVGTDAGKLKGEGPSSNASKEVTLRELSEFFGADFLDRPVVLRKGVWHGIITLGKESEVKITENAHVRCVYWQLPACSLVAAGFTYRGSRE